MECQKEKNADNCSCSKLSCPRRGLCCECIARHRKLRQLPACFFNESAEKTYDRSFEHFAELVKKGEV